MILLDLEARGLGVPARLDVEDRCEALEDVLEACLLIALTVACPISSLLVMYMPYSKHS